MSEPIETVIAFDYGSKRIGVAVGQTLSGTAQAVTVVKQKNGRINWPEIEKIIAEWRPDRIVLGFPATRDGRAITLHSAIERFAQDLKKRFDVPVELCDEHLSSFEAAQREPDQHVLDAMAAQIILETWLNAARQKKY